MRPVSAERQRLGRGGARRRPRARALRGVVGERVAVRPDSPRRSMRCSRRSRACRRAGASGRRAPFARRRARARGAAFCGSTYSASTQHAKAAIRWSFAGQRMQATAQPKGSPARAASVPPCSRPPPLRRLDPGRQAARLPSASHFAAVLRGAALELERRVGVAGSSVRPLRKAAVALRSSDVAVGAESSSVGTSSSSGARRHWC